MTISHIKYRIASVEDIDLVVSLHIRTFKFNFTTLLGKAFLYQYYNLFLNSSFYFFIATKENEVVGFIVGTNDYTLLARSLKRNIHLFLFPILRSVLNISLIPIVFKRVASFLFNNRANPIPKKFSMYNEVTSFAVSNESQGLGIGSGLLQYYLSHICNKDQLGVFITTDATKNTPTINFYKKNGFLIKHTYNQSKKRKMHLMLKECIQ